MIRHLILILAVFLASNVIAQTEATLSKDSLRCPSATSGVVYDALTISSSADWEMASDSMIITVVEADAAFLSRVSTSVPQFYMSINNNPVFYTLARRSATAFTLTSGRIIQLPVGGSAFPDSPKLGYCISTPCPNTEYPQSMKAVLSIYLPNGQRLDIRLYTASSSSVMQPAGVKGPVIGRSSSRSFMLNGQMVKTKRATSVDATVRGTNVRP